jgi:hypothetical protein
MLVTIYVKHQGGATFREVRKIIDTTWLKGYVQSLYCDPRVERVLVGL